MVICNVGCIFILFYFREKGFVGFEFCWVVYFCVFFCKKGLRFFGEKRYLEGMELCCGVLCFLVGVVDMIFWLLGCVEESGFVVFFVG